MPFPIPQKDSVRAFLHPASIHPGTARYGHSDLPVPRLCFQQINKLTHNKEKICRPDTIFIFDLGPALGLVFAKNLKTLWGMKHFLILIMAIAPVLLHAQTQEQRAIHAAFEKGDAKQLGAYLSTGVDLSIRDVEGVYSQDQTIQILNRFFSDNTPSLFKQIHTGKSKSEDYFYIGDLQTSTGRFRVTYFLKNSDTGFLIKQLRIEQRQ